MDSMSSFDAVGRCSCEGLGSTWHAPVCREVTSPTRCDVMPNLLWCFPRPGLRILIFKEVYAHAHAVQLPSISLSTNCDAFKNPVHLCPLFWEALVLLQRRCGGACGGAKL